MASIYPTQPRRPSLLNLFGPLGSLAAGLVNKSNNPGTPLYSQIGISRTTPTRADYSPTLGASTQQYQEPVDTRTDAQRFGALLGGTYQPSSGGQPAAPTGDSGGDSGSSYVDQLRQAYDYARSLVSDQLPGLEADYTRIKGDIEGALGRAKETYGEQKEDIRRGYGEGLRNLIQSNRELEQKSRNVYSGLNALDSSSFAESNEKARQSFIETQGKLTSERERSNREAERQYSAYESQANQALADLGNQYQAGRQALQSAIANNRIEEATNIMNYLQNLQNTISSYKLNLAQLQAQGTDVVGALQKLNRGGLDNIFGNYLSSVYNPMMGQLKIPTNNLAGSGYIGASKDEELKRLYGLA